MKNQPELSIITVNYNGLQDTIILIESIIEHISEPYELIVIDNGSKRNEASVLQSIYPSIKAVRLEKNLGFSGGNNVGIKESRGEYLLFINNDTFISDDSILSLISTLKRNPHCGGVSPKILFADSEEGIQFAGYTPLSRITLRNSLIGFKEEDTGQYNIPSFTPYLHGAAMMIKRDAIQKAGLMPEIYFLYYEELDWSIRIRRQGYQLEYNPSATVYHKESSSTGQQSPLKYFYMTRNRLLFARRNLKGIYRILSILYQLLIACPFNLVRLLSKSQFASCWAIVQGCFAFLCMKLYD